MEKTTEEITEKVILKPSDNPEVTAIIEQPEIIEPPIFADPDPDPVTDIEPEPEHDPAPPPAKLEIIRNEAKGFDFITLAIFGLIIALAILIYIKYGKDD